MNIGALTVTLGVDASGLSRAAIAMQQFEKKTVTSLNTISQRFRTFGYLATAAITAPIVMAGKASINMAKDFEFSMQKIVGLAGVAQSAVDDWTDTVLRMGPQVAKTPKELAEALYFIASSGIKGKEALDVLETSAKAATAGLGDTVQVADVLTSALNAYAGTGLTASRAADILIAAVREGKGEADAFASSLGQIIPIAANLGVSFDQVAGGMSAITLTGSSASNAAVYLKGVFNTLLKATTNGETALNAMNTSYAQLRKILREDGLIALMQKLRDLQMQYGDEAISDVLPNIRALTGFMSLAGKNFKYNSELMERVVNSSGSLGKAFAAVSDTIKVRYDQAISAANVSLIDLGKSIAEAVLPILEKLVKGLENLTKWFDSLTEAQKRHKLVLVGIIALLGPLSLLISIIGYSITGLISVVSGLTKAMALFRLAALSNPWVLVATAAATLIGVLIGAKNRTKEFADEQNKLKDVLVDVNGEMKKMKDLAESDYSKMTLTNLSSAYVTAWNNALEAKKKYDGYVEARKQDKAAWMKAGKYDILEEAAFGDWNVAKDALQKIGNAMDNFKTVQKGVIEPTKDVSDILKSQADALERLNEEWGKINTDIWEKKWKAMTPPLGYNTNLKLKTPGQMMGVAPILPGGGFMPSIPKEDIEETNRQMERAKALASELTKVFTNMFETMGEGWQSVVDSIIQGIKRLVAVVMARLVVFGILSMLSGGTGKLAMSVGKLIKGGFWDFMLEPLGRGLSKGASGGIVPPGFSNDTYPALLSSGEKVIPAGIGHADTIRLEVDTIRVAGKDLAIVLRRAGQYN